jgi:hypothetical protein
MLVGEAAAQKLLALDLLIGLHHLQLGCLGIQGLLQE